MMISHKHRCVFIHLPKCGGQSVEDVFIKDSGLDWETREPLLLRRNENSRVGPPWLAHLTYNEYLNFSYISSELMEKYYKFTVVLNPYDRLVSIYNYLGYCFVVPFDKFVRSELPRQLISGADRNYFFKPQKDFLVDAEGRVSVDKIVRLENIGVDIVEVFHRVGIKIDELPHINSSPEHGGLLSMKNKIKYLKRGMFSLAMRHNVEWTDVLREKVFELYRDDFEIFGY